MSFARPARRRSGNRPHPALSPLRTRHPRAPQAGSAARKARRRENHANLMACHGDILKSGAPTRIHEATGMSAAAIRFAPIVAWRSTARRVCVRSWYADRSWGSPDARFFRNVRKALELLRATAAQQYSVSELAAACGVAPRTLQKHFRRFLGRTLLEVRLDARLKRARQELLRARPERQRDRYRAALRGKPFRAVCGALSCTLSRNPVHHPAPMPAYRCWRGQFVHESSDTP